MAEGSVAVPGDWLLGYRPKLWFEQFPQYRIKFGKQIKQFYLDLPKYADNYTNFNCGHFASHFAANKMKADVVHMYGFNSLFEMDLFSSSDLYLHSNRDWQNNIKLTQNWRTVWKGLFEEFPNTEFRLYYTHKNIKLPVPENVNIVVRSKR